MSGASGFLRRNKYLLINTASLFTALVFIITGISCKKETTAEDGRPLLTWWSPDRSRSYVKTMAELPVFKTLQDETGISLQFIHPSSGQHAEQFKAMLASGRLPDVISHDFVNDYPGGVEKAIEDDIIIPLNAVLKTDAPYFTAFLAGHPDVAEMLRTDDGRYFCFPSLQLEREIRTYMGPFYRADLFEDLRLEAPQTIDEWTAVLAELKKSEQVDIPLSFYGGSIRQTNAFIGAYGIGWGFYQTDGRVIYGPLESGFAAFISVLADWYKKGYIDPGFAVNSLRLYREQAGKKNIGILIDYVSKMDSYSHELETGNPESRFLPLRYPALFSGQRAEFGHLAPSIVPFACAYITSSCSDPSAAVRMLDYVYSPEGKQLFNFGIEGESFDLIEGAPVFRKELSDAPGGFTEAVKRYVVAGPYWKDPRQFEQFLYRPEQQQAVRLWADTNAAVHELPPLYPAAEESGELYAVMQRIVPYEEKRVLRIITGAEPVSSVGSFQQDLRYMGIERAVEIMQNSFDRKSK